MVMSGGCRNAGLKRRWVCCRWDGTSLFGGRALFFVSVVVASLPFSFSTGGCWCDGGVDFVVAAVVPCWEKEGGGGGGGGGGGEMLDVFSGFVVVLGESCGWGHYFLSGTSGVIP